MIIENSKPIKTIVMGKYAFNFDLVGKYAFNFLLVEIYAFNFCLIEIYTEGKVWVLNI